MKTRIAASLLAVLGGAMAMLAPTESLAGNVGYHLACGFGGSPAAAITQAGHTPVAVTVLDDSSLSALDGLVITTCHGGYTGSPAVGTAVANGLRLLLDTSDSPSPAMLPGNPVLAFGPLNSCSDLVSMTPGAAITTGPGGSLNDSSLDYFGGVCSALGWIDASTLPAGSQSFVELESTPGHSVAAAYPAGDGLVALSTSQWMAALPGGYSESGSENWIPGALTYYVNTIAWMMEGVIEPEPTTTCAGEGYTGAKLTWCKNICESELSAAQIETWLHRWINRYRTLPYCAMDDEEAPQPE